MFSKILIANRGEIAVRIIRACKEMGIASVAVYSEADRQALHVDLADESLCIGPASASRSYLDENQIIRAALATGAEAIHPGYGFLSENAHFAQQCQRNGIVFIGPTPELMTQVSNKTEMKRQMKAAGIPVIPGTDTLPTVEEAIAAAQKIGYPVMLKACEGGGGRGIRLINSAKELEEQFPLAQAEAQAAFGDGSLYVEKNVFPARHIEVQGLADELAKVAGLGERDCSVQRHHQKLIEETPSPGVNDKQRKELFGYAVKAVKALGYTGAGTLEFLMNSKGEFHIMEMNVRLQVEHGISEILSNVDLVKWQIRTAAGIEMPFRQKDIHLNGYCLECRINAQGPGTIKQLHIPGGPFVRFDSALVAGTQVGVFYDSLIGKLMVYAATREEVLRKMRAALCELVIDGIETNQAEQLRLVSDRKFSVGEYDCTFLERQVVV